jgi:hypothetical protein
VSKVTGKKVVRRSKRRKTVTNSPASLPPQVPDVDTTAPLPSAIIVPKSLNSGGSEDVPATVPIKKAFWDVGKDSKVYETAMRILALRTTGIDDRRIADTLNLSMQTIWNYCYIAGKNGWADDFANAKDQIEFRIMPKVIRNLEEGLDDNIRHETSGMQVKTQVALRIAEGTLFKKFEEAAVTTETNLTIGIRVEHVGGDSVDIAVRPGTITGVPAYLDAEVIKE